MGRKKNPELARLLTQGVKAIAAQRDCNINIVQDELAYRCAQAAGVEELSGHAVQKWRQEGYIPREEYVEVLARACIREGGMGHDWFRSFLHQAKYYGADTLIAELFPDGNTSKGQVRIYHNLSHPDYQEFIGREQELNEVRQRLRPYPHSTHHVITLKGVAGVGKTAVAMETARRYLYQSHTFPASEQFGAIIWFSAKTYYLTPESIRPRLAPQRTLEDLYTAIATTLEQRHILDLPLARQHDLIRQILQRQRTLIILDNLETVDDDRLMAFLREPPVPTKIILTTRHWVEVAFPVMLEGMTDEDAAKFIGRECQRQTVVLSNDDTELLMQRTGKVPLAIVWSIGRIGHGLSVADVLRDLQDAEGDFAQFCFKRSVSEIRERNAFKLLMALTMFGGQAEREPLGKVAGLAQNYKERDKELAKLEKFSLISRQGNQFEMLPLTYEYAQNELSHHPDFDAEAFNRWVDWIIDENAALSDYFDQEEDLFGHAREFIFPAQERVWILNAHPKEPSLDQQTKWIREGCVDNGKVMTAGELLANRLQNARRLVQRHGYYDELLLRAQQSRGEFQYVRVVQAPGDKFSIQEIGYDYLRHFFKMTKVQKEAREQNAQISVLLYKGVPHRNKTFVLVDKKYILVQDNELVDGAFLMRGLRVIYDPPATILKTFENIFEKIQSHSTEVSYASMKRMYESLPTLADALVYPLVELISDLAAAQHPGFEQQVELLFKDMATNKDPEMQEVFSSVQSVWAEYKQGS